MRNAIKNRLGDLWCWLRHRHQWQCGRMGRWGWVQCGTCGRWEVEEFVR